jgi:hypothetical protein
MSLLALLAVAASIAPAQQSVNDPVDALSEALRVECKTKADLEERKKALEDLTSVKRLPDADMHRALAADWKDQDKDESVAAVDEAVRKALIARFKRWLTSVLENKGLENHDTRLAAITLLAEMGTTVRGAGEKRLPLATDMTPQLVALLAEKDASLRDAAARGLGKILPEPMSATKALGALLAGGDAAGRLAAADGLANMVRVLGLVTGSRVSMTLEVGRPEAITMAQLAMNALANGLADKDAAVRRRCLEAMPPAALLLADLGEVQVRDLPPPTRFLSEEDRQKSEQYSKEVENTLKEVTPLAKALDGQVQGVIGCLDPGDPATTVAACKALEELAVARRRIYLEPSAFLRFAAAQKAKVNAPTDPLSQLGKGVPALASLAAQRHVRLRLAALYVLETIEGSAAAPAAGSVIKALDDNDVFVRWAAARALGKMAPAEAKTAVTELAKRVEDENGDVRISALAALERYGAAAKEAVPILAKAVNKGDDDTRIRTIRVLGSLRRDADAAVPALITALSVEEVQVRLAATEALGKIGIGARLAVPALRKAIEDADASVRQAASAALLAVQGP